MAKGRPLFYLAVGLLRSKFTFISTSQHVGKESLQKCIFSMNSLSQLEMTSFYRLFYSSVLL